MSQNKSEEFIYPNLNDKSNDIDQVRQYKKQQIDCLTHTSTPVRQVIFD